MSFASYFKISSYCLICAGFLSIAATGIMDVLSLALFASLLVLSCLVDTTVIGKRISSLTMNSIVLLFVAFSFVDFRFISRSFVVTAVHFLFFASAIKLLTLSRDRDYFFLYLISFAELLAAAILTIDIAFGIFFFIFLLSAVSTLILFEMRRSNARALKGGTVRPLIATKKLEGTGMELFSRFPAGLMLGMTLAMTCLILLLAIPLFVLVPRVSTGALNRPWGHAHMISGFSERVELGHGGTIRESDAVVMRVRVSEPPEKLSSTLKWRGLALEQFDGRTWRRVSAARQRISPQARYYKLEKFAQGTDLLYQTFFLEALSTDVIFASHRVLAVSDDLDSMQRDSSGNMFTTMHASRKLRYAAISDMTQPLIEAIPLKTDIPEEAKQCCLQLPALDPRIENLARRVTESVGHPYAKARALENYLRTAYAYSLELSAVQEGKDPLAVFLFETRRGHCEYFASALAVMLRQLGTPARLVNGFRAGEFNGIGDAFVVRQYHAHSWVEAYFSPYGWIELDPTPVQALRPRPAFAHLFLDTLDALDIWWWESIVNYDFGKQYNLVLGLRSGVTDSWRRLRFALDKLKSKSQNAIDASDLRSTFSKMPGILSVLMLFVLSGLFLFFRRRRNWFQRLKHRLRRAVHPHDENSAAVSFYYEALDILNSYGFSRAPSQTPLEFCRSLGENPASGPLRDLTHLYNRVRYGDSERPAASGKARNLLKALNKALHLGKRTRTNTGRG
jgi:transglutaminase-like putative cysteine protease